MFDWALEGIKDLLTDLGAWIGKGIGWTIINNSYWICFTICMLALFMYISGLKKAGKYIPWSIVSYFILQSLKLVLE